MTGKKMLIIVDDREHDSGVIDEFESMENVQVRLERLDIGDYKIGEHLLFERKTLSDLALSIVQGRFFSQARRLAASSYRGVLVLEGSSKDLYRGSVSREAIQGALINSSVFLGLAVLRSFDPGETARLLVYTGRQLNRVVSGGIYRHGRRPGGKRKRQLFILQGLPGIGSERASRLLDTFGSVENVFNASSADLTRVSGIGTKTAEEIKYVLREREGCYQI